MKKVNYLDKVPKISPKIKWNISDDRVVLTLVNKGIFNYIFQKLIKKPKESKIHLDEIGSYVWKKIDGKNTIYEIAKSLKIDFGKKAEPIYSRLVNYFSMLCEYRFIYFV